MPHETLTMRRSVSITCKGRVQGVFYRASTKQQADELGIVGWVRNETNGDVLIHAEGPEEQIVRLIEWCKIGPQFSRVDEVVVESISFSAEPDEFRIRH